MRIIGNQFEKRFVSCMTKNSQKSIRLNPINSDTLIRLNANQSESFWPWIHSEWFWLKIRFGWIRTRIDSHWSEFKNKSDLIRLIPRHQSESIRIIPTLDSFRMILIENSVWIDPSSDWFALIWIQKSIRLNPINTETSIQINPKPSFQSRTDWS